MTKEKPVEKTSNYTLLFVILLFGAAMAVLGTKEVNKEYAELQARRKQPLTPEQILADRKVLVTAFQSEFELIKKPMLGRASFSADRYKDGEGADDPQPSHNKMALNDLLKRIIPSRLSSKDDKSAAN